MAKACNVCCASLCVTHIHHEDTELLDVHRERIGTDGGAKAEGCGGVRATDLCVLNIVLNDLPHLREVPAIPTQAEETRSV